MTTPQGRPGRRPLPVHMRRNERISIVLTAAERATVIRAADRAGRTVSDFLRGIVLEGMREKS